MAVEFDRLIAYFSGDISEIKTAVEKAHSIIGTLEKRIQNFKSEIKFNINTNAFADLSKQIQSANTHLATLQKTGSRTISAPTFTDTVKPQTITAPQVKLGGSDSAYQKAQADIRRYQQQTSNGEKALTNIVRQQAEQQYRARTREIERGANEYLRELKRIASAEQANTKAKFAARNNSGGIFNAVLGGNLAAQAVSQVTSSVIGGGSALLDYASKLENVKVGFTTLLGSSQAAESHLKDLQQFAKTTPFAFDELTQASQRLQGVGVSAQKVIPLLNDIGNAVAAVGGGTEQINGVTVAISQLISKGKVSAEELEQLAERQINGYKILGKELNVTQGEARKLVEQGKITSDQFIAAFQKFSQINFGDAMVKQSRTFSGAVGNIKDSLFITANTAFAPLYERISNLAVRFADDIQAQGNDFKGVGNVIAQYVGEGLGLGLQVALDGLAGYIGNRLANIFTKGEIFDPLFLSLAKGFAKPFGFFKEETQKAVNDVKKIDSSIATIGNTSNQLPKLSDKLDFDKAKKDAKELANTISSISSPGIKNAVELERQKGIFATNITGSPLSLPLSLAPIAKVSNQPPPTTQQPALSIDSKKADLDTLKANAKQAEQILKNRYTVEKALLDSSVRYTTEQEKQYTTKSFELKNRLIQSEIAQQTGFFNKQIQLNEGNAAEIERLQAEKNLTLGNLNNELKINAIESVREIAALERKSFDERRKAAIDFKNLILREANFNFDNKSFDISRDIEAGNVSAEAGFARLRQITQDNYQQILQTTKENLALQLQDQSLSADERNNVIKQGYLDEQQLAEDNRRNIVSIQDRQKQEIVSRLTEQFQTIQSLYQAQGDLVGSIAAKFFDPANFSANSNKGFQDIILGKSIARKADDAFGNYQALKASPESTEPQIKAALDAFTKLEAENSKFKASFQSLDPVIQGVYTVIGNLGNQLQTTAGTYENFDKIARLSLFAKQKTDLEAFNAEIRLNETLLRNAKENYKNELAEKINTKAIQREQIKRENPGVEPLIVFSLGKEIDKAKQELKEFEETGFTTNNEITRLEANLKKLGIGLTTLKTDQTKEQVDQAKESLKGLREEIESLRNGTAGSINGVLEGFAKNAEQQTKATLINIISLKEQLKGFETGDKATIQSAEEAARQQILQQQVGSYNQLIYLKEQLANYDKTEQLQIQIAAEERLLAIRQASTQQAIAANQTIQDRVNLTLAQLPAYQTQIKDFFGQLPESIGNVFDTAVQNWDGTFKGLFKSIGQSFAQLLQQLAADLLRAQIIKLVGSLVGLVGGLFGSGGGNLLGFSPGGAGISGSFADGGIITGPGTATSDSIPIYASNGEYMQPTKAVEYYGVEFMNAVRTLQLPKPAERQKFANGGLISAGPDIFVPSFNGNENVNLQNNSNRSTNNRSGTTINNTINIPQTFNAPRGTIAPKSLKQSQEHALAGVSRGLRDK